MGWANAVTTVETCFGGVWDSPEGRMGRSEVSTVVTCFGGGGTPRGLGESTVDTCFGEGRDAPRGERMKNRGSHGGHIFQVGAKKKRWTP